MTDAEALFQLSRFVRHRPWCPEFNGPGDCTCGLYALLDSIRCTTCDHKVSVHTNRDVSDVVGWPCSECKSERCTGFAHSCYDPETMAAALHGHRHAHQCLPADGLTADTIAARALYATGGNADAPKAPIVDLLEEVRRWVASIGATNLDTGRKVTKADALAVIDRVLGGLR